MSQYARLPNSALNMRGFDQTSLGQRALQQRGQYQQRVGAQQPEGASFYGDMKVGVQPQNQMANLGQRLHQGSPTSNREVSAYSDHLMQPMGQDQADKLQGISPMPGHGLAMGRAENAAGQFANDYRSAVQKQMAWTPPPMAQPGGPHRDLDQLNAHANSVVGQFNQNYAAGQHPGMLPNPSKMPSIADGQGGDLGAPGMLRGAGGGGMAAAPAAPQPDLPMDPHVHGLALNPNNAFRVPGGGIGVHGIPQIRQPGVQAGGGFAAQSPGPADPFAGMHPMVAHQLRQESEHQAAETRMLNGQADLFANRGPGSGLAAEIVKGRSAAGLPVTPQDVAQAQQLEAQITGKGGQPLSPTADPSTFLQTNHPAMAGLFSPPGLKPGETPDIDMLANQVIGMGAPGYDDPSSPLGQALRGKIGATYGSEATNLGPIAGAPEVLNMARAAWDTAVPWPLNKIGGYVPGMMIDNANRAHSDRENTMGLLAKLQGSQPASPAAGPQTPLAAAAQPAPPAQAQASLNFPAAISGLSSMFHSALATRHAPNPPPFLDFRR